MKRLMLAVGLFVGVITFAATADADHACYGGYGGFGGYPGYRYRTSYYPVSPYRVHTHHYHSYTPRYHHHYPHHHSHYGHGRYYGSGISIHLGF